MNKSFGRVQIFSTKSSFFGLSDFRLNPILRKACKADIPKFCQGILNSATADGELEGQVIACLKLKYADQVRPAAQNIFLQFLLRPPPLPLLVVTHAPVLRLSAPVHRLRGPDPHHPAGVGAGLPTGPSAAAPLHSGGSPALRRRAKLT